MSQPDDQAKFYLSNKNLMEEIELSKATGQMTANLAGMLQLLTSRIARKGQFINYSYNEDMQAYALLLLVRTWKGFNPEKSNNPFAFYTQCIHNSFKQYLKQEKKQRRVKDLLLIDGGLNPSFYYEEEDASHRDEITTSDDPNHAPPVVQPMEVDEDAVDLDGDDDEDNESPLPLDQAGSDITDDDDEETQ